MSNISLIYFFIILVSFFLNKKKQSLVFLLLLVTYLLKVESKDLIYVVYPLKDGSKWVNENISMNFILNNSARILQHSLLTVVIYIYAYKDRRCFIPILINTMIVVLYTLSNSLILFSDIYEIQRFIYDYNILTGFIIILSLFDYGDKFYDRLYSYRVFTNNKYIGRLYSTLVFRIIEKEAKKESRVV